MAIHPNLSFRLGLCCKLVTQPIHFRTTTAKHLLRLYLQERRQKLSEIALANARALFATLKYCAEHGIRCFRINSQFLPLYTHPEVGYQISDLPGAEAILTQMRHCANFATEQNIRLVFHPDQFVVLNSSKDDVVVNSIRELEYHGELCQWLGADVINIHAGARHSNKATALESLARGIDRLSFAVRSRLTLENDDKTYSPADLLPFCRQIEVPLVYDVHHHRCLPDNLTIEQATAEAIGTWNREPLFHISSPRDGWKKPIPSRHHDYIS
jgi:UV DNA damage endonuclease